MSEVVIRVENLSKRYTIQHSSARKSGDGLRHAISDVVAAPFRRFRKSAHQYHPEAYRVSSSEEFYALRDVSFEVRRGEVLGIIGHNGAGKSTLLKILSRITEPTSGRVGIKGRVASLLEVGTGFHPELTGRENIYLNGAILGMSQAEVRAKFDEIVAFAEVEKFLDLPVKRYSSGMYVRLAFAVAAHLEPEILIVDEVLAVGDAQFQKKCMGKMGEVAQQGRTIIFVSHQMGVVASLCGKAILMRSGQVASTGRVEDVLREYLKVSGSHNRFELACGTFEKATNRILSVQIEDSEGNASGEFAFTESVCIEIKLHLGQCTSSMLLGIALDNALQSRVFTILREASLIRQTGVNGCCLAKVRLPKALIAPGRYSFTVALFEPKSTVHHHLQHICPIQIVDDGTDHAIFEGIDYGSVIVTPVWQK